MPTATEQHHEQQVAEFWNWDDLAGAPGAFTESHRVFQGKCSAFVERELIPNIQQWDEDKGFPQELHGLAYDAGVRGAMWPKMYGGTAPAFEEADMYHHFIFWDQMSRVCGAGLNASLFSITVGLAPVIALGTEAQKESVARAVITGEKNICLGVTEPGRGSDVANVQTTALLDASGDFYVVDGQKMFISGGMHMDYFTTLVRTGDAGVSGLSLLLIDKNTPGVKTTRLKTQGWHCSTRTMVTFHGARVPVADRLGQEGEGFKTIMRNFNNERLSLVYQANRTARVCLEDAIRYACLRKTFGKLLIQHQGIRHKLMECARHIMVTHAFALSILAQKPRFEDESDHLSGAIALCKVQASKGLEMVATECSQVLGGKAHLRKGPGQNIERACREMRVFANCGGSEEIMLDLASKQAKL